MKVSRKLSIVAIGLFLVVGTITSYDIIQKHRSSETVKMAQTKQSNLVDRLTSATGSTIHVLNYSDLAIEKMADVYQLSTQEKIQEQLLQLIESQTATFTQPLIVSNPFLTNTTGLYLAFSTDEAVKISYRIDAQGYPSFEKNLKQNEEYESVPDPLDHTGLYMPGTWSNWHHPADSPYRALFHGHGILLCEKFKAASWLVHRNESL